MWEEDGVTTVELPTAGLWPCKIENKRFEFGYYPEIRQNSNSTINTNKIFDSQVFPKLSKPNTKMNKKNKIS